MTNTDKNDFNATIGNTVLCDGFLIPMTDFVLKYYSDETMDELQILDLINNYATFLKQPLKLEMFVPCDDEGIVLEEPKIEEEYLDEHTTQIFAQYQYDLDKAKEKVLFEGFEQYEDYECAKYEEIYIDEEVCDGEFTIEELIKDVGETKIKLSQTALYSIFGKTVA